MSQLSWHSLVGISPLPLPSLVLLENFVNFVNFAQPCKSNNNSSNDNPVQQQQRSVARLRLRRKSSSGLSTTKLRAF